MSKDPSSSSADRELNAILALLKAETTVQPSAAAVAAAVAAAPPRRGFGWPPTAALAACAVLGLAVGFGASRLTPNTEEQALDAVISASFGAYGYEEGSTDG